MKIDFQTISTVLSFFFHICLDHYLEFYHEQISRRTRLFRFRATVQNVRICDFSMKNRPSKLSNTYRDLSSLTLQLVDRIDFICFSTNFRYKFPIPKVDQSVDTPSIGILQGFSNFQVITENTSFMHSKVLNSKKSGLLHFV